MSTNTGPWSTKLTPLLVFPVCYNETYKRKSLREHQQTAVNRHSMPGNPEQSIINAKKFADQ